MTKKELNRQRVLNGGRGSGDHIRYLVDHYENRIFYLESKISELEEANNLQAIRLKEKDDLLNEALKEIAELKGSKK